MCGLIASLGKVDVARGLAAMTHRGIRATIRSSKCGQIGHVRLPIVGLDHEYDQPVAVGSNMLLAFVGEILDFRDQDFTAACDLQTAIRLWEARGPRGFSERDGFWSVVVVDDVKERICILCDYLAQKPLYYRTDAPLVASEPVALLQNALPTSIDEIYMAAVVKWGYCPDVQRTPYQEIKKVLPGECVTIGLSGVLDRWIADPLVPIPMAPLEIKAEIENAVHRRVTSSDVPVAVLVSGGLDSSIVYTLAKRYGDVVPYYAYDEHDASEQLAVSAVTKGRDVKVVKWSSVDLEDALKIMQEPVDLGSLVPQVALSRVIAERVCLTGDGADELFGGYGRATRYDSQASDIWHELIAWHLPRLDRVMMRSKIEVRSPFLARRVVAGALSQPWSVRRDKRLLRDLYRDDLPPTLSERPKKPLRTRRVEESREEHSLELVNMFRRMNTWN